MKLEGRLRDLAAAEVLQLLAGSRKSGTLTVRAPLEGRVGWIRLHTGRIVGAGQQPLDSALGTAPPDPGGPLHGADVPTERLALLEATLTVLQWREGTFTFDQRADGAEAPPGPHLAVETVVMEAAMRADAWARIADLVPHARVVPTFGAVEPQQLPLLHLAAHEWELLTRIDGQRDVQRLAELLGRDVVQVATLVHRLIGTGLLALHDPGQAVRVHPTPPAVPAVPDDAPSAPEPSDLWIPGRNDGYPADDLDGEEDDSLFDPMRPIRPAGTPGAVASGAVAPGAVASGRAEPSLPLEAGATAPVVTNVAGEAARRCAAGDAAARRGDLVGALASWTAAVREPQALPVAEADRVREAIALAARLHALLHPEHPIEERTGACPSWITPHG